MEARSTNPHKSTVLLFFHVMEKQMCQQVLRVQCVDNLTRGMLVCNGHQGGGKELSKGTQGCSCRVHFSDVS
jgi:hypothetical protein